MSLRGETREENEEMMAERARELHIQDILRQHGKKDYSDPDLEEDDMRGLISDARWRSGNMV